MISRFANLAFNRKYIPRVFCVAYIFSDRRHVGLVSLADVVAFYLEISLSAHNSLFISHNTMCSVYMKKLTATAPRRYISRSAYECVMYARRICQLQYRGFILDSDSSSGSPFCFSSFSVILQLIICTVNFMRFITVVGAQFKRQKEQRRYLINSALRECIHYRRSSG